MLKIKRIGKKIFYFDSIDSTNEFVKSLVVGDEGEVDGAIVIANEQTKGKGRLKRRWLSGRGGIYISLVLRQRDVRNVSVLNVLSALPVAKSIKNLGLDCTIKWPNDFIIKGKKVGGILGELVSSGEKSYAIIGIGLNTNIDISRFPGEFRNSTTSIKKELGTDISNNKLIEDLLKEYESFFAEYEKGEYQELLKKYKELSVTLGKQVVVKCTDKTIEGLALDILTDGSLLVKAGAEEKKVLEGDVVECRALS